MNVKLVTAIFTFVFLTPLFSQEEASKPQYDESKVFDGRGVFPFRVLDNPKFIKAKEAKYLDDGDYILGVSLAGESKAYPTKMMWWHHIANDTIGHNKTAITVVY